MELSTVPHRPHAGERRRLVLALVVLVPVALLFLLPAGLGLHRYVVTDGSMNGTLGKGSVVLDRNVPAGDLRVGDLITFTRPDGATGGSGGSGGSGDKVTRRIVALRQGMVTTRGDDAAAVDPWRLPLDRPTYSRVVLHLPWIGYPFLAPGGWLLLFAALAGGVLLSAWNLRLRGPRPRRPVVNAGRPTSPGTVGVG